MQSHSLLQSHEQKSETGVSGDTKRRREEGGYEAGNGDVAYQPGYWDGGSHQPDPHHGCTEEEPMSASVMILSCCTVPMRKKGEERGKKEKQRKML